MDFIYHYDSPLGIITMAGDGSALTGLWFSGQKHFGETLSADHAERFLPVFAETVRWLDLYFSGGIPDFTPALNLRGTAFRRAVWAVLLTIPYGRTTTYGRIAETLTAQKETGRLSAQAVGNAVGHNPVSLIVPCHRVVGADGSLTGYAGGTDRKKRLLELECRSSSFTF